VFRRAGAWSFLPAALVYSCGNDEPNTATATDSGAGGAPPAHDVAAGEAGAGRRAAGQAGADHDASGGTADVHPTPTDPTCGSDCSSGGGGTGGEAGADASGAGVGGGPPPPHGAFRVLVQSVSFRSCASGVSTEIEAPTVDPYLIPSQTLDESTYLHRLTDGEDGASVRCRVAGDTTFVVEGSISLGGKSFTITDGVLGPNEQGTARLTLSDSQWPTLTEPLSSGEATCVLDASSPFGAGRRVQPGAIWGHISCPVVERPDSFCSAEAEFVFEDCQTQ